MTSGEDWSRLARVLRAGADESRNWEYNASRQQDAQVLDRMAVECEAISHEVSDPKTRMIACASCKELKPGPGFFRKLHDGRVARWCGDCEESLGRPVAPIITDRYPH